MKKGAVIAIIIVFAVIIISLVAYLIYRSSKKKSEAELLALQNQLAALQSQLSSPSTPPQERKNLLSQIGDLVQQLQSSGVNVNNVLNRNQGGGTAVGGGGSTVIQPPGFPLKKTPGYNPIVENLQKGLNKKCNSGLITDGKFGKLTEDALMKCYNVNQVDFALYNQIVS